jgi:hypothetical protein
MSRPPGRTSAPDASISALPRGEPPSWLILLSVIPTSHSPEPPAVTTVPPDDQIAPGAR